MGLGARFDPSPGLVFAAITAAIAFVGWDASGDGWVTIVDHANLAFHEAGHVFFGLLGETLGLYGGTLGQLVFPMVVTVQSWRRGYVLGVMLGGVWFFENWLNIARYMADARAQELPLVGGGEHDWTNIFSRWGALESDTDVAGFVQFLAWCGLLAVWAWAGWRWINRPTVISAEEQLVRETRAALKRKVSSNAPPPSDALPRVSDERFQELQRMRDSGAITEQQFAEALRSGNAKT